MAHDFRMTDVVAKAMLDAFHTAAGNEGILRIYASAGTPDVPAGEPSAGASHGTLLAELTMAATAFGDAAADGAYVKITAGTITADSSANNAGDAKYFVLYNSAGTTAICQGTAGESGDTPDAVLDDATIAAGAEVGCTSFVVKLPKGWVSA